MNAKQNLLDEIRPLLGYGALSEVAEKHLCTVANVRNVLRGFHENPEILKTILEKLKENREKIDSILERVTETAN